MRRILLAAALALAACNLPSVQSVAVSPASATVTAGKTLQLGAVSSVPVMWSVREPGGGTVSSTGLYTAPATPGTWHVVAITTDGSRSASATITVVAAAQTPAISTGRAATSGRTATASVPAQEGVTFSWSIFNGTLAGTSGTLVSFTAGELGEMVLVCAAVNAAGDRAADGVAVVPVVAMPRTPIISAPLDLTAGRAGMTAGVPADPGASYAWNVVNGAITAAGGGSITFTAGSPGTLVLSVVASNAAGDTAPAASATVQVHPTGLELRAGGLGGAGTADGQGADARFSLPWGIAADPGGALYVADYGASTIRHVDASGNVTTVAGVPGVAGYLDGPSAGAYFSNPYGVAVDPAGIYVTDANRIRQIAGGVVSTLAGSGTYGSTDADGTAADFANPQAIGANPDGGSLWVHDFGSGQLRHVTSNPDGGMAVVQTPFLFQPPYSGAVAVTADDTPYYSEIFDHLVARANAGSPELVAGSPSNPGYADGTSALFDEPRGLAFDPASGSLYVGDTANHVLRRLDFAAGQWTASTIAGQQGVAGYQDGAAGSALLGTVMGVASPTPGVVAFTELDGMVRRLSAGQVTTLAGKAAQVGRVDGPALSARFSFIPGAPLGVVVDDQSNTWVGDDVFVRRISADGVVSTFAGAPNGDGAWRDGLAAEALFSQISGIALDRENLILYVSDYGTGTVRAITWDASLQAEVVHTVAGMPNDCSQGDSEDALAAGICNPTGLAVDSQGRVFIAEEGRSTIRLLERTADGGGYRITTIMGAGGNCGEVGVEELGQGVCAPGGLAVDAQDRLYIADTENHMVRRMVQSGSGWTIEDLAGSGVCGAADGDGLAGAELCRPSGVTVDRDGNVWIADRGNGAVRKLTPLVPSPIWQASTPAGQLGRQGVKPGALPARANQPAGLAFTPFGDLVVLDGAENSALLVRVP